MFRVLICSLFVVCAGLASCARMTPVEIEEYEAATLKKSREKESEQAYQVVSNHTEIATDDFTGVSSISGPYFPEPGILSGLIHSGHTLRLSARKKAGVDWMVALYVNVRCRDWLFLESAYARGGIPLKVIDRDRNVLGANSLMETLAFYIPLPMLRSSRESGIEIKLLGDRGSLEVLVPSGYVRAFLEVFDRETSKYN